jgi:hypothetical protein
MEDDIQQQIDERYNYTPTVRDPADPMRGTVRGLFGLMTGERQRSRDAAMQQMEMEARARQASQMNNAYLLQSRVEEDKFNRQYPNIEVEYAEGKKINLRELARQNPQLADRLLASEMDVAVRYSQVKKAKDDAEMEQAMAKIATARTKIEQEQAKRAGIFGLGGPNQKVIEEQKRVIDDQSQTYGIPLGSEPEEATPQPAAQAGAASSWLRSVLR